MAGKNKGGREIRKPKQASKPKAAKSGTDQAKVERQIQQPRAK